MSSKVGVCSSCEGTRELTTHGDCFKCHISGLGIKTKCSNCGKHVDEYRIKKDITSKVEVRQV